MLASQKERREGGTSVEYDLILARSVTYAQRMQRALNRAGIRITNGIIAHLGKLPPQVIPDDHLCIIPFSCQIPVFL